MLRAEFAWYGGRLVGQFADPDPGRGVDVDVDLGTGIGGGAGSALLTTLIVGALLIAVAPAFTERAVDHVWDTPVGSLLWGVLGIGGVIAVAILLVISVVGLLFVIPFVLVAYVAWAVGSTVAFLAVGERLAEAFDLGSDGRASRGPQGGGSGAPEDRPRSTDHGWGSGDERYGSAGDDGSAADESWSSRGDGRDWLVPLLLAALLNGGLVLSGIGGLVAFVVGLVGFGALLQDWLE